MRTLLVVALSLAPATAALATAYGLAACAQTPPVPVVHDASSGTTAGATWQAQDASLACDGGGDPAECACARLRSWACPLGSDPNCAPALRLGGRFGASPSCVLTAPGPGSLSACNVACR